MGVLLGSTSAAKLASVLEDNVAAANSDKGGEEDDQAHEQHDSRALIRQLLTVVLVELISSDFGAIRGQKLSLLHIV